MMELDELDANRFTGCLLGMACVILFVLMMTVRWCKHVQAGQVRTITFADTLWVVKARCGLGPGPNCWSDSEESVWVDENEWLHMKIREIDGQWHSSEVYTPDCTTYGTHRFYLIGQLDELDPNVIAAPFLYGSDIHELDIEFTQWGDSNAHPAQYVVQPYHEPNHMVRFPMALDGTYTTHSINWQPDAVQFDSIHGHYSSPPDSSFVIQEWRYTGNDIPVESDCLRVHINLWQRQGFAPADGAEVELIIADVELPTEEQAPMSVTITAATIQLGNGQNLLYLALILLVGTVKVAERKRLASKLMSRLPSRYDI